MHLPTAPSLVIADEPTGNIDPELSLEMMELLERVSEMGITVVVVTHEHELVRQFHQRVVTLKKGRIISDVPADRKPSGSGQSAGSACLRPGWNRKTLQKRRRPPYDETFYLLLPGPARRVQSGQALGHDLCVHPCPSASV